ncbi:PREDICTED: uncharacterized protein LOC104588353 isoform X2 [Nelumbo nucifera]|uniref:Protein ENHANCED DISEASE RESISTANCE 4-like n=2 Tax=Nelumbo nucifera TaxID=4432 RepID=A0A822Y2I0_NELNU|nr:PREDICTED: uncharacterized protein LOC104588353 isoform X2 [Nelumbo nucifera]DAD25751.1 TPA_asm: hypothetical protein HUJ06_027219 [Nelumbo nucifera]
MTRRTATGVRLVKCPKCLVVLQESAPLYKCGGCDTILQAKIHKDGKSVTPEELEKNPMQKNGPEANFEDKESANSSKKTTPCMGESPPRLKSRKEEIEPGDCNEVSPGNRKYPNELTTSSDLDFSLQKESSPEAGANIEVKRNNKNSSNLRCPSPDSQLSSKGRSSTSAIQKVSDEGNPSKPNSFPSNEQVEQSQKISAHDFNHITPRDTVETIEPIDHGMTSEELIGTLQDFLGTKDRAMRNSSKVQSQAREFFSMSSSVSEHGPASMEGLNKDNDELQEPIRQGIQAQGNLKSQGVKGFHPVQHWRRSEKDGFLSRKAFYTRGLPTFYENGSSSNYGHQNYKHSSSLYSSDKFEYCEQMELLRKIDELREQFNRLYNQRGKLKGRVIARCSQEKQRPLYYNYKKPDSETLRFYDGKYSQYPCGAYMPVNSGHQQCKYVQTPFSGQATHCQHHVDYSCLRCCSEDWQCLTQFPSASLCYNKGPCGSHPGLRSCDPYTSTSASPQQHKDSNFHPCGCKTLSHEQRLDHEVQKSYFREKHHSNKRHCLPIGGGAPFITCHSCRELVHLPADSLAQKRCLRLQCGACSNILSFSLFKRGHIIPYTSSQMFFPPSEVGNSNDATAGMKVASSSHSRDYPPGDPVSYSEEYGLPSCKSFSTDGEPAFLPHRLPRLQSNTGVKMDPLSSWPKTVEERNNSALKEPWNMFKNSGEASTSSSQYSNAKKLEKLSMEVEVVQTASPLHRLMGYSSPSEMIYGTAAVSDACSDPERKLLSRV